MADAPAGGSNWGTLEIILVAVLAIGLLSKLSGVDLSVPEETQKPAVITTPSTKPQCGVTVLRPKPLEKIGGFLTLNGTVSGCGWTPKAFTALYAQVVDAYGIPMSDYISVPVSATTQAGVATFSTSILITGTPAPGTGYVILIPAETDPSSERQNTTRIPITFKK